MDLIAPLRTFVKVVEVGSFAAAADALGLSPQLVGKHVQSLEQHLGVRLLNRTTRKQSLTDFGQAYLARARVILEEVEGRAAGRSSARAADGAPARQRTGHLRRACTGTGGGGLPAAVPGRAG